MRSSGRTGLFQRLSAPLLGGLLACIPIASWGQAAPAASSSQTTSLGDSLQRGDGKQLHIFYLHGIGSDGPGDHDSLALRQGICDFVKDCIIYAGEHDGTEYADQDEFALNATPPPLKYLGQEVWRKDHSADSSEEWNAAAPFVVHWKLARYHRAPTIYVDEINWWPLVFSLKCRQIVENDAALVGPAADRIKLCSRKEPDKTEDGRFISYDWIPTEDAPRLLALAHRGALVNRRLKNGILDWGFSDAVLALGPLRTYLLDGIRQLILKSVAVSPDGIRGGSATPRDDQEFVIVSHSLGSYLIFAALDIGPATLKTSTFKLGNAFEEILKRTSLVYFFANQLRLLELASLDGASDKNLVTHLEDWGKLRCEYLTPSAGTAQPCARPKIVALNDPSDLLTWTVPEQIASVEVQNVMVKNTRHWFWLIASPTKAHDNYAKNKSAVGQMLKLHQP